MNVKPKSFRLITRAAMTLLLSVLTATTAWAQDVEAIDGLTYNTAGGYYEINDAQDLIDLATYVNGVNDAQGKTFKVTQDIVFTHTTAWNDASSTEDNYTAIGGYIGDSYQYFSGHFDGQGHTISGIRIYKGGITNDDLNQGLFGYIVGSTAEVKNVILADARITGYDGTGGIAGINNGKITNCHVLSDVTIHTVQGDCHDHGGIVGYNSGTVTGCTSAASITSSADGSANYGGIAGINYGGTIKDCLYLGNTVEGNLYVGGIVGLNHLNSSTVQNSYYTSTTIQGKDKTGNILDNANSAVGYNDNGTITNCGLVSSDDIAQSGDTYTIGTTRGWDTFCGMLYHNNTYNRFSGKTVKLGADITVSRMAGSDGHEFTGTFDGAGHTLTVQYGTASEPVNQQFVAPFPNVTGGATFRNLTIAGSIYSGYATNGDKGTGGLIGHLFGGVTVEHCVSTVTVNAASDRAGGFVGLCEHAVTFTDCVSSAIVTCTGSGSGFVGWSRNGEHTIAFYGCLFDGKVLKQGTVGSGNGSFVGWKGFIKTIEITNCIVDPAALTQGETMASDNSATFCRYSADTTLDNGETHITNCYYTAAFDIAQGKTPHTVAAAADVTIGAVALTGTATQYTVSGITAYSGGGLQRGDALYYGKDDQVSLTLSNSATGAPQGYQYGYTASAGTLSGTTLTMPDENVTISVNTAALAPIDWATESVGDADHPYMIYNKDQLLLLAYRVNGTHGETAVANGYSGKYFRLGADIAYSHSTDWNDAESTENNYEAIGYFDGTKLRSFCGDFDGAGHTISGIRIHRSGSDYTDQNQGIFGQTGNSANIHGLRLADARITGYDYTGGIVGSNDGTVTDCHVASNVCIHAVQSNASNHGGIAGYNWGTVENSTSAATLTISTAATDCWFYGGIAGINYGTLRDNLAIGATVPATSSNTHGAIVGINYNGTLQRNYYTACKVASTDVTPSGVGCQNADVAEMTKDEVTYYDGAVPALRDNADNTKAIALLAALASTTDNHTPVDLGWGAGKYPMQLAGRTLYKDGAWNTLCLPFDVTVSGSVLDGDDVVVKTLTGSAFAGGTLTLDFSANSETTLTAGTPYLVRWTKPDGYDDNPSAFDLTSPVFTGVTVSSTPAATVTAGSDYVDFVGTYQPASIFEESKEKHNLYLGTENKLYYPTTAGITVNACRGYFRLKNGLTAGEATSGVRAFVLNFGDETTGIVSAEALRATLSPERNSSLFTLHSSLSAWYTLDGRKLSGKPTRRGLYIHNGIKVVIK